MNKIFFRTSLIALVVSLVMGVASIWGFTDLLDGPQEELFFKVWWSDLVLLCTSLIGMLVLKIRT